MNWQSLPKVELHLHMDTSLNFEGAVQLNPALTRSLPEEVLGFVVPIPAVGVGMRTQLDI